MESTRPITNHKKRKHEINDDEEEVKDSFKLKGNTPKKLRKEEKVHSQEVDTDIA